jgi:acyl-CoA synthetase (AMP-forming)/AMP-acid ligase II
VVVTEALPRNAAGKLLRARVRDEYGGDVAS